MLQGDKGTVLLSPVIVANAIILYRHWVTVCAVGKDKGITPNGHLYKGAAIVNVGIVGAAVGALCAHTIGIVGKAPCGVTLTIPRKL